MINKRTRKLQHIHTLRKVFNHADIALIAAQQKGCLIIIILIFASHDDEVNDKCNDKYVHVMK